MLADHFTATEWARYAQGGAVVGMRRLRRYLGGRYIRGVVEPYLPAPRYSRATCATSNSTTPYGRLLAWALLFCGLLIADVVVGLKRGVFSATSETLLQISGTLL